MPPRFKIIADLTECVCGSPGFHGPFGSRVVPYLSDAS